MRTSSWIDLARLILLAIPALLLYLLNSIICDEQIDMD